MKELIVIYQAGKVGSSSLYHSLKKEGNYRVVHIHRLGYANIGRYLDILGTDIHYELQPNFPALYQLCKRRGRVETIASLLPAMRVKMAIKRGEKIKFITLVRDPIARNISSFFQNLDIFLKISSGTSLGNLKSLFSSRFHHLNILNWFDHELGKSLGINIYDTCFDKESGYGRLSSGQFEVLSLRLEKLDYIWREAFTQIGIKLDRFEKNNISESKPYGAVYNEFKRDLKFDSDFLGFIYGSNYSRHFIDEGERDKLIQKWMYR